MPALFLLFALALPPGQIIDDVPTAADPEQRYALYLPAKYNASRPWPVIFAFDPGARGRRAVEQYQVAAETFGYIVAASNNSRNGSWAGSMNAARAMAVDVTSRFAIDEKRIYTAGMSGGARVAMGVAMTSNNMVAGVIASSAGFPDSQPRKSVPFAVFGTAGTEDFNWLEMRSLDKALTSPHHVAFFPGGHVWLPSELAVEALEWLDLEALKTGRLPADEARLKSICDARLARARSVVGEWARHRALLQHQADCGLPAPTLTKAVEDARKADAAEEFQERRLLGDVLDLENDLNKPDDRNQALARLHNLWKRMAADAEGPADTAARRSARRVTRGLLSGGQNRVRDTEYLRLLDTFRARLRGPR